MNTNKKLPCRKRTYQKVGYKLELFDIEQAFMGTYHSKRAAKNAIKLYNQIRLHLSSDFKTPNMVYKL